MKTTDAKEQVTQQAMAASRRKAFIQELARFLVGNEAGKSILLQMRGREPEVPMPNLILEWQRLRNCSPLMGYYTDESKAVKELEAFLNKP